MRIEITNGFVEIRDAMNRKTRSAYLEALYFGIKVDPSEAEHKHPKFPLTNIPRAQNALTTNLVKRIVVDGVEVPNFLRYMDEEMDEADYDKVARACQKVETPAVEEEKKTQLSTIIDVGDAAPQIVSPKK